MAKISGKSNIVGDSIQMGHSEYVASSTQLVIPHATEAPLLADSAYSKDVSRFGTYTAFANSPANTGCAALNVQDDIESPYVPESHKVLQAEGEQKILFNFLQRYQLGQHFEKLVSERVTRVQHLKNTRNETLRNLGFSDAEIDRLKVKLSQNFGDGALGKVKVGCWEIFIII